MAYIGNDIQVAFPSYRIIDDISGSFNGVLKTFALRINGTAPVPFPINPQQCLISVNNVVQKPDPSGATGFKLVGTNIVFASAPTAGWAFFGTVLAGADYVNVGVSFPDGSVTAPSITFDADTNTGFYRVGGDQIGITCGGVNVGTFTASGPTFQVPAGTVIYTACNTAPTGYLKANGAAISRTTYATLFSAIGTTYGSGDGSTTFNLPDLRGEFVRGWDDGRGIDSGRVMGSNQAQSYQSHTHSVSDPGHAHSDQTNDGTGGGQGGGGANTGTRTVSTGSNVTGISIGNSGSAETRPRNIALLGCIKT